MPTDATERALDLADERGYVLVSELEDLDTDREELLETLQDRDVMVVDDQPGDEEEQPGPADVMAGDGVRLYLNQAGQHELLDKEDEADLAKRFEAGRAAQRRLDSEEELTGRQRAQLRRIVKDGRAAQDRLVTANLRLVMPTATKYAGDDMPLIEAIQEGNLGLMRAVEKFDHTKGYKFSTYAVWWIRQAIQRGLAHTGRTIRVPSSVWEDSGKIRRASARLRTELERDPTDAEIAEATGLNEQRVVDVREALKPLTSLDMPVGEDGDTSLGALIEDPDAVDPAADSEAADLRNRLQDSLDTLPHRQRRILELRYGLTGQEPQTLKDTGAEVGLTRERVRQLEREALRSLQDPASDHGLAGAADTLAA